MFIDDYYITVQLWTSYDLGEVRWNRNKILQSSRWLFSFPEGLKSCLPWKTFKNSFLIHKYQIKSCIETQGSPSLKVLRKRAIYSHGSHLAPHKPEENMFQVAAPNVQYNFDRESYQQGGTVLLGTSFIWREKRGTCIIIAQRGRFTG